MNQKLRNTLEAGRVIRYHAATSVQPQTVGLHAYGVATLALYLTGGKASAGLLVESLLHDSGEYFTGDIPYTFKKAHPEIRAILHSFEATARKEETILPETELALEDQAILKICDTLEGLIWCAIHEEKEGPVYRRWVNAYRIARVKFMHIVPPSVWERADAVYSHYQNGLSPL